MIPILFKKNRRLWTPRDLPNLALWLDASDLSTIILNGSNVSQWNDKSGNVSIFSQPIAASQPAYESNNQCLSFNGSSHELLGSNIGNLLRNISNALVYVVIRTGSLNNSGRTLYISGNVSGVARAMIYSVSSGLHSLFGRRLDNDAGQVVSTGSGTRLALTDYIQGAVINYNTANIQIRINGLVLADTSFQSPGNTSNTSPAVVNIGSQPTSTNFFQGLIRQIVVVHNYRSDDAIKLEGFLAHYTKTNTNLPINHPFKNYPPRK